MKIALLGGSNSVKRFGLSSGLKENTNIEFYNFALGGCTCLQNLDAIITNYEKLCTMDLIITESNINDFYNVNTEVVPFILMKKNMAKYYLLLSQLNIKVISLLLPINEHKISEDAFRLFNDVNNEHLFHVRNYGFDYINIENYVSTFLRENKSIRLKKPRNFLVPDGFHTKSLFMHQVGLNLYTHFSKKVPYEDCEKGKKEPVDFIKLKATQFKNLSIVSKENSFFKESMIIVDKKISFPSQYLGYKIIGISTWGEGGLKLSNTSKSIIKNFNDLYSFNEILEDFFIDSKTYMINCHELITEKSMNTSSDKSNKNPAVVGFLLEDIQNKYQISIGNKYFSKLKYFQGKYDIFSAKFKQEEEESNLSFLLPPLEIYLYDSEEFVKKVSEEDIDSLRDGAVLLEDIDLKIAYKLMTIAHLNRPSGVYIKNKVLEYQRKLNL